jgi:hypothetical protein
MPTDIANVCLSAQNGTHRHTLKMALLVRARRRADTASFLLYRHTEALGLVR